jgi:hypothetical protein
LLSWSRDFDGSLMAAAGGFDYRVSPSGNVFVVEASLRPRQGRQFRAKHRPVTIEVVPSLAEAKAACERHCSKMETSGQNSDDE